MLAARYFVILLWVLFYSGTNAAHCPITDTSIPVVSMCSDEEASSSNVIINVSSASVLRDGVFDTCKCNVSSQNDTTSYDVWVYYPGHGCGSKVQLQSSIDGRGTIYPCTGSELNDFAARNFIVSFTKLTPPFSAEYCLRLVPDSGNTTVRCFSNPGLTSSTTQKTTQKTSTTTAVTKPMTETSKVSTNTKTTSVTTNPAEKLTDNGEKDEGDIVPVAVGAGVGGVVVIAVMVVVPLIFCRRNKGESSSSKSTNIHEGVEMTDNALYNIPVADDDTVKEKNSALEIRHIEVEGGDIYALPSKPNTKSQLQNRRTLQEDYSEPLGAVTGRKNPEPETVDGSQHHINHALVGEDGKSQHYAEPDDCIETPKTGIGMDSTYAEIC